MFRPQSYKMESARGLRASLVPAAMASKWFMVSFRRMTK
jgi:hypothetical protein